MRLAPFGFLRALRPRPAPDVEALARAAYAAVRPIDVAHGHRVVPFNELHPSNQQRYRVIVRGVLRELGARR